MLTGDGTRIQVDVIIGCEILGGGIFVFFQPITGYKMWLFNLKKQDKRQFRNSLILFLKSVFPLSKEKILYCIYNILSKIF